MEAIKNEAPELKRNVYELMICVKLIKNLGMLLKELYQKLSRHWKKNQIQKNNK